MWYRTIVSVIAFVSVAGCTTADAPTAPATTAAVAVQHVGAVASPDPYGAMVAEQILARGGNAVDAAIDTAFTLAVTYPEGGNIGGGGFMTIWYDGQP